MNDTLFSLQKYSPFLSNIIARYPDFVQEISEKGVDEVFEELKSTLNNLYSPSVNDLMREMRIAKKKAALLIAIADIKCLWTLRKVTLALSELAQICIQLTVTFLLHKLVKKEEIITRDTKNINKDSSIFVLAMGKLGAFELNYSSDIDLIIFFESERIVYIGKDNIQRCLSKMAQEMVRILQERTAEGYVFRVDLRLRPDPASTPVAMSVAGAITYYETVGQNWERAAFIKARPIAGDIEAGYRFLQQIAPFIWRKHLDFAAIADIQSIKRQMDERTGGKITLPGHNIKTGIGGIREIEFFCQINQLIWGGRIIALRTPATVRTLNALAEASMITPEKAESLKESYCFLRECEHRLQMIDDQQTHLIPVTEEARQHFAGFMGFALLAEFENTLENHLESVHHNFVNAFKSHGTLGSDYGKLSFTGVENDPQTLKTLNKMGYKNPASVSERIQAWHRGSCRSTRNKRARELITELTPKLLKTLSDNYNPDQAFMKFDEFLSRLPSGVQLFSLFHVNPQLLNLISLIMGSAPAMAELLSKNPLLLDTVIGNDFDQAFLDKHTLFNELSSLLLVARGFEDEMDIIRRFRNEKQFQAGVQLIRKQSDALAVGRYLSDIADTALEAMLHRLEVHFRQKNPVLSNGALAIIALGRLGARELTFGSDIDMVFVYDSEAHNALLSANHSVYNKLSERFISSVTSLTREGRLYEIDTRLRPSGNNGALAVSEDAFARYFSESAWTFELMAFTRARVITGNINLRHKISDTIQHNIMRTRAVELIAQDIVVLREKITKEFGSDHIWNLKYAHGGLMDLDFLAQYYVLIHARKQSSLIGCASSEIFTQLIASGLMAETVGDTLIKAQQFMTSLFAILRLCGQGQFNEEQAPEGLKRLITYIMGEADFISIKEKLIEIQRHVITHFDKEIILKAQSRKV